jgi:hypothetical protein
MRRLLAIGLMSLIGIASPAFAQAPVNQGAPQSAQAPDGQPPGSPDGLDAFNQVPPGPGVGAPLLLGGGLLVGGAILIGVAVSNNDDTTTNTTTPASP